MVRLKEVIFNPECFFNPGFNSKMVRLKAIPKSLLNAVFFGFNSKMVRLKGFAIANWDAIYKCFNSKMVRLKAER